MSMLSSSCCVVIAFASLGAVVESQMQFEIPAEMLQGGYGGGMQQQQQRRQEPKLKWPRGVSKEV